jgi:hypothetical protein
MRPVPWPSVLALVLGALLAAPAGAVPLPLPQNGRFDHGAQGWIVTGHAVIADGTAQLGQAGCVGPEDSGTSGAIETELPAALEPPLKLEFDYVLQTSDTAFYDGIRVQAVGAVGPLRTLESFNPHTTSGDCVTLRGHHRLFLPLNLAPFAALRLSVYEDGRGDLTHAVLDNVTLELL